MKTETAKRILELAWEAGALLYGEFTLTSGKKSDHYFEGKRLTLHPEGTYLIGKEILDRLVGIDVDAIGGLVMGAFPIITAVALVSHQEGTPIPSFIVREQPKEHGTRRKIEGHLSKGFKVAIVDDVITTGGSVKKAIEAVEAEGCEVVKVIVIVDRNEGGSERLRKEGYDFEAIIDLPPSGEASISESSVKAFISHGKESMALTKIEKFLRELGIQPIIVKDQPSLDKDLPDKIDYYLCQADFVIILAAGDDQVEDILQPRQNVIHETGLAQKTHQGKIIYLLEEGAELPSNIRPKVYERFTQENIEAAFSRIVIELRELGILKAVKPLTEE